MATLMWQRDISSDVDNVKDTFSSWDSCMSEAYCKWPVIVAIIVGSLIVLSLLLCCARCLCCGLECCCGICSCCNACCPSPRNKRNKNDGYQQQQSPPMAYPPYAQYQSQAPPMYAGGGYRGAQTATFDVPSRKNAAPGAVHEDTLPAMPSWNNADSRHVEEEVPADEGLEMGQLGHNAAQQQSLLAHDSNYQNAPSSPYRDTTQSGDLGTYQNTGYGQAASPYHDYNAHQQYSAPSVAGTSAYPPTYHTTSPRSTVYEPAQQQQSWGGGYAPSVAAPSYHTYAPVSPPPMQMSGGNGAQIGRKPVSGTWRDV